MNVTARTRINMIIGDPVEHSLSPLLHNAAYHAQGIDDQYVFLAVRIKPDQLADAVASVRTFNIRGLTCTMPHKSTIMQFLDRVDPVAQIIGAVNTAVNENGLLTGYNTDWHGTLDPLLQVLQRYEKKCSDLSGKRVALIGAGGAARAMAYAVVAAHSKLHIFNRTVETARRIARDMQSYATQNIEAHALEKLELVQDCDIILNATSIGLNEDKSPVPAEFLHVDQIVFDAVYHPFETKLMRDAHAAGAYTIHGTEMLLYQAFPQYELYTGHQAPREVMKQKLYDILSIHS